MPDLPGDIREAILWQLQDVLKRIQAIEQLLCLSEEEDNVSS